jgi:hypothetical protein
MSVMSAKTQHSVETQADVEKLPYYDIESGYRTSEI